VFYATIYARSPELIEGDIPFGGPADFPGRELDRLFRKIAWQAVVHNPLSGVIDQNHDGIADRRPTGNAKPSAAVESGTPPTTK